MSRCIVISRFNESLEWIESIPCNIYKKIFNKGDDKYNHLLVEQLPNIGRESHTYLKYIIDNYYNLNEYTIFCQGYPLDHCGDDFCQKIQQLTNDTYKSFSNLSFNVLDLNAPNHMNFGDIHPADIYRKYINKNISNIQYKLFVNACFEVHKNNITRHPRQMYVDLFNLHLTNDFMPYIMEYSWHLLFDDIYNT